MASLNKVILIGRLTGNPDLRYTPGGNAVATFTLAVDRRPTSSGEREADFIRIVTWNKTAESCANQLTKGRLVAVEGRLQIRSWEAQDGTRRREAEVIANSVQFLDWPKEAKGIAETESSVERPDRLKTGEENVEEDISFDDGPFKDTE